jgi:hypothetical protein
MRKRGPRPAIVLLALVLAASSCRARSDRDLVADAIADLADRVEDRDAVGLAALLSDRYVDFEGRDRNATQAMAQEYFERYRGIKIKVLSSRIAMGAPAQAAAEFDVAIYSGVGAALRKAVGFSGENYRVACEFRKQQAWRIVGARWDYVPLQSLFPESLKILREIFPDL